METKLALSNNTIESRTISTERKAFQITETLVWADSATIILDAYVSKCFLMCLYALTVNLRHIFRAYLSHGRCQNEERENVQFLFKTGRTALKLVLHCTTRCHNLQKIYVRIGGCVRSVIIRAFVRSTKVRST